MADLPPINLSRPLRRVRIVNGGFPGAKIFLFVRDRFAEIHKQFYREQISLRQVAKMEGVSPGFFKDALDLIDQFGESLSRSDFGPLEKHLFGRFGHYKILPFFEPIAAGKKWERPEPMATSVKKKRGPKPGSKRIKPPVAPAMAPKAGVGEEPTYGGADLHLPPPPAQSAIKDLTQQMHKGAKP